MISKPSSLRTTIAVYMLAMPFPQIAVAEPLNVSKSAFVPWPDYCHRKHARRRSRRISRRETLRAGLFGATINRNSANYGTRPGSRIRRTGRWRAQCHQRRVHLGKHCNRQCQEGHQRHIPCNQPKTFAPLPCGILLPA